MRRQISWEPGGGRQIWWRLALVTSASGRRDSWKQVMAINLDSAAELFRVLDPVLKLSPVGDGWS